MHTSLINLKLFNQIRPFIKELIKTFTDQNKMIVLLYRLCLQLRTRIKRV